MRARIIRLIVLVVALIGVLVIVPLLMGSFVPRSHVATRTADYGQPAEVIWAAITEVESFPDWRADVDRVERLPDREGRMVWREAGQFGVMTLEVVEFQPPRRLTTRIADPNLPFGGTWEWVIEPFAGGSSVTITERGEIYNPFFRFMSRFVMGYDRTMNKYLDDLGGKFGEEVRPYTPR